jgi:DNA invertase Pin-like site-specific DNA recombinase
MRVAIYARISTKRHGQDVETQLMPLREYAKNRGLAVHSEYIDAGVSGSKDSRPRLDELMKDARARRFDAVIVARFDRFARSTRHLVTALEEFQALGIHFISLSESIDTSTPMGKMVFTVLSAVAELERNIIRERVMAGLDRARKQKKQLGRPRRIFDRQKAIWLHREGNSIRDIATTLGIGKDTIHAAIRGE